MSRTPKETEYLGMHGQEGGQKVAPPVFCQQSCLPDAACAVLSGPWLPHPALSYVVSQSLSSSRWRGSTRHKEKLQQLLDRTSLMNVFGVCGLL